MSQITPKLFTSLFYFSLFTISFTIMSMNSFDQSFPGGVTPCWLTSTARLNGINRGDKVDPSNPCLTFSVNLPATLPVVVCCFLLLTTYYLLLTSYFLLLTTYYLLLTTYLLLLPALSPLVENIGFEPMTPCLQSRCSSQLS